MELFSVFKICIKSVCYALKILDTLKNGTKIDKGNIMSVGKYLSMQEILDLKDTERTLHIKEKLRKENFRNMLSKWKEIHFGIDMNVYTFLGIKLFKKNCWIQYSQECYYSIPLSYSCSEVF